MNEADLLIVVGASFANHTGIAPYKAILQIDDNPAAIGRFDPVSAGIVGDATLTIEALLEELGAIRTEDQRPAVAARWAIWRAEKSLVPSGRRDGVKIPVRAGLRLAGAAGARWQGWPGLLGFAVSGVAAGGGWSRPSADAVEPWRA